MKPKLTNREQKVIKKKGKKAKKDYQTLYRLRKKGENSIRYLLFLEQTLPEKQLKLIFKQKLAEPLIWSALRRDKSLSDTIYRRLYLIKNMNYELQEDGKLTFCSNTSSDIIFQGIPTSMKDVLPEPNLATPWEKRKQEKKAARRKEKRLKRGDFE